MKDNKIEERKNMLREFFEDEKYKPMRYKDIVGLLQVPRESKHELKQVLDTLISEGFIVLDHKGRYTRPGDFIKIGMFRYSKGIWIRYN